MNALAPDHGRRQRARWLAWAGFALGAVLLVGAIFTLVSNDPDAIRETVGHIRGAPPWAAAVILLGPLVNWLLISACLWVLMLRHGRLGWSEMNALVGSAWLLNHLPLRPGLVGRVGYHRAINRIRVRDSIESTVWSLGLAGVCGVMAVALAFALPVDAGVAESLAVVGGPTVVIAVGAGLCRAAGRRTWSLLLAALALRYADLGLWALRYAAVFWVLGMDVGPIEIVIVTGASQVAQLVPIAGGGLGLREWLVAITAGSLGSAFDSALAGDLTNRVAETLTVIPVGLACSLFVAKRIAAARKAGIEIDTAMSEEAGA